MIKPKPESFSVSLAGKARPVKSPANNQLKSKNYFCQRVQTRLRFKILNGTLPPLFLLFQCGNQEGVVIVVQRGNKPLTLK